MATRRGFSAWGWVWIGISLVLVTAMASLWLVWPPQCTGSPLCVGGPDRPERRVPSTQASASQNRHESGEREGVQRVPSPSPEPERVPSKTQAPDLTVQSVQTVQPAASSNGSHPSEKPSGSDSGDPDGSHPEPEEQDHTYGWEKHGKDTPPGHEQDHGHDKD